ncbi:MAG TPA: hypothetical protein VLA37_10845 [Sphingomonadaceae bacterium]|nr:hypothetical protein [Sphingomonadaceae bacterium]
MASVADFVEMTKVSPPRSLAAFIDRWIFVFMAGLFIVTVLAGFIPTSIEKVMEVQAGVRPPLPLVLHVHAVLMGSWMLLLLTQTVLMATGRSAWHKQLGVAGMVIAPAMVLTGFFLVPTMVGYNFERIALAPPEILTPEAAEEARMFLSSLVAAQISVGVLFLVCVYLGLRARKTDAGFHKRMMILASVLPLPAAIDRMAWLPTTYPDSAVSVYLYPLLWIAPMLLWDLLRGNGFHSAYRVWLVLYIPAALVVIYLWWKPWWIEIAQRLVGVSA